MVNIPKIGDYVLVYSHEKYSKDVVMFINETIGRIVKVDDDYWSYGCFFVQYDNIPHDLEYGFRDYGTKEENKLLFKKSSIRFFSESKSELEKITPKYSLTKKTIDLDKLYVYRTYWLEHDMSKYKEIIGKVSYGNNFYKYLGGDRLYCTITGYLINKDYKNVDLMIHNRDWLGIREATLEEILDYNCRIFNI